MDEFPQSGHLNLSHLFWLRCLAIIGQALAMVVASSVLGCRLPLLAMSCVIVFEITFNAFTLVRMSRPGLESNSELFGQLCVDLGALTALLMLSGGTVNPFFSLYLPALAIGAAVLPWRLGSALTGVAVLGYVLLAMFSLPLVLPHSHDMFDLYRTGNWINFLISVCLISWFVARMSRVLRRREAALAEAQQRLLRDERVVALGAQAASIAHEMGSPLSTIALLAEELRESAVTDQQLAPYRGDFTLLEQQITLCKEALKRLQSRAASPNRRRLRPWLANFVEQWRLRHPQAGFQSHGVGSDNVVIDDTVAVGQILTILLDNAARASGDYVVFEVASTLSDEQGDVESDTAGTAGRGDHVDNGGRASRAGNNGSRLGASAPAIANGGNAKFGSVIFRITDRGPGIPPALRAQIGSTPVRSTQGGAGVGLYLAFVTAARLHGTIELSDASDVPGTGTCATLTLPAMRAEAPDE